MNETQNAMPFDMTHHHCGDDHVLHVFIGVMHSQYEINSQMRAPFKQPQGFFDHLPSWNDN